MLHIILVSSKVFYVKLQVKSYFLSLLNDFTILKMTKV